MKKMNEKNKVFDKTGKARKLRKMMSCSCVSGDSRIHVVYGCERENMDRISFGRRATLGKRLRKPLSDGFASGKVSINVCLSSSCRLLVVL